MSFADLKPVRLHLQTHVFYLFPEFQDDYASGCPKMEHPQFNAPLVFTVTGVIHPLLPTIQVMTHINMFVKFTMCFCG